MLIFTKQRERRNVAAGYSLIIPHCGMPKKTAALSRVKEGLLFVNKKKQKNFVNLGRAGFNATGPNQKKFLRRFFHRL
jgi:hypothetical protein